MPSLFASSSSFNYRKVSFASLARNHTVKNDDAELDGYKKIKNLIIEIKSGKFSSDAGKLGEAIKSIVDDAPTEVKDKVLSHLLCIYFVYHNQDNFGLFSDGRINQEKIVNFFTDNKEHNEHHNFFLNLNGPSAYTSINLKELFSSYISKDIKLEREGGKCYMTIEVSKDKGLQVEVNAGDDKYAEHTAGIKNRIINTKQGDLDKFKDDHVTFLGVLKINQEKLDRNELKKVCKFLVGDEPTIPQEILAKLEVNELQVNNLTPESKKILKRLFNFSFFLSWTKNYADKVNDKLKYLENYLNRNLSGGDKKSMVPIGSTQPAVVVSEQQNGGMLRFKKIENTGVNNETETVKNVETIKKYCQGKHPGLWQNVEQIFSNLRCGVTPANISDIQKNLINICEKDASLFVKLVGLFGLNLKDTIKFVRVEADLRQLLGNLFSFNSDQLDRATGQISRSKINIAKEVDKMLRVSEEAKEKDQNAASSLEKALFGYSNIEKPRFLGGGKNKYALSIKGFEDRNFAIIVDPENVIKEAKQEEEMDRVLKQKDEKYKTELLKEMDPRNKEKDEEYKGKLLEEVDLGNKVKDKNGVEAPVKVVYKHEYPLSRITSVQQYAHEYGETVCFFPNNVKSIKNYLAGIEDVEKRRDAAVHLHTQLMKMSVAFGVEKINHGDLHVNNLVVEIDDNKLEEDKFEDHKFVTLKAIDFGHRKHASTHQNPIIDIEYIFKGRPEFGPMELFRVEKMEKHYPDEKILLWGGVIEEEMISQFRVGKNSLFKEIEQESKVRASLKDDELSLWKVTQYAAWIASEASLFKEKHKPTFTGRDKFLTARNYPGAKNATATS